jgi:hypothetical protein
LERGCGRKVVLLERQVQLAGEFNGDAAVEPILLSDD